MTTTESQLDTADLTERVKEMYQEVALHPEHEFHFETGRQPGAEALRLSARDALDRGDRRRLPGGRDRVRLGASRPPARKAGWRGDPI